MIWFANGTLQHVAQACLFAFGFAPCLLRHALFDTGELAIGFTGLIFHFV